MNAPDPAASALGLAARLEAHATACGGSIAREAREDAQQLRDFACELQDEREMHRAAAACARSAAPSH